jgi:hypothetical protein
VSRPEMNHRLPQDCAVTMPQALSIHDIPDPVGVEFSCVKSDMLCYHAWVDISV